MTEISATITIAAPPAQVWTTLADLASYPQWNPLFREASGTELRWVSSLPGIISGEHSFAKQRAESSYQPARS
jgi:uncharacterized protein YndB with AHSA1/START domain